MHPFKKDILSLVIILVIIISSLSACESQKGKSDHDNIVKSLEILADLNKWIKIESEAFNNRDYCTAMKACQNELELWEEYKKVGEESQLVTVNEQIRAAEDRRRTVRALCR
jgi:hypothetical protein